MALAKIPNSTNLFYEDICQRDFGNLELNEYCARQISLDSSQKPLDPSTYVKNWVELETYVNRCTVALRQTSS